MVSHHLAGESAVLSRFSLEYVPSFLPKLSRFGAVRLRYGARLMSEVCETTPFRCDRSQGSSPTPADERLRRGSDPDRKWPWVMLGVFMGVMLIVLQSGDASTCSPHLAVMMGFAPGVLAGIAATKFWIGGNANAILLSASKLRQTVVAAVLQTPVPRGGASYAEA